MESKWILSCFFLVLTSFVYSSNGYEFHVGGKAGWVPNPSENYNHWAGRMRFQVNDTLYFRYKKGSDSVLVVTKDSYDSCNTTNPIKSLTDGHSIFKFDHSGPFFFISGNADKCQENQKLIVVVMAVRHHRQAPPSPSPDHPVSPTPAESPKSADTPANPPRNGEVPTPTPAPAPSKSGSICLGCSVGSVLGYSARLSMVLALFGTFAGMF